MNSHPVNPAHWRLSTLSRLSADDIHELAAKSVGTLTTFRLILGRCLIALQESKGYKEYGCSGAIHYACSRLGLCPRVARTCRRVAMALEGLPHLSLAAEFGVIEWSKLREIVRKAGPLTEEFWLKLASRKSYAEIEALVRRTPVGSIPGEMSEEDDCYRSELRCSLAPEVGAMLDQALRCYSQEAGQAVTTAQVVEMALASYIAGRQVDDGTLTKVRDQSRRDVLAQKARRLPLVREARELAVSMGILDVDGGPIGATGEQPEASGDGAGTPVSEDASHCAQENTSTDSPATNAAAVSISASICTPGNLSADTPTTPSAALSATAPPSTAKPTGAFSDLLAQALGCEQGCHLAEPPWPARVTPGCQNPTEDETLPNLGKRSADSHNKTLSADIPFVPLDELADWRNKQLEFHPKRRSPSPSQRRELLRRDGWCCRTPGCPNRIWLHLHHLHEYARGGETVSNNLLGLCVGCHSNVHEGILKITVDESGHLVFMDARGRRLDKQADLELASWLDFHLGWSGQEHESHWNLAHLDEWSVYGVVG